MDDYKIVREVYFYKRYFLDFYETLKPEVQQKFNWTLKLISVIDRVPQKYFKHITNSTGLYEVRVEFSSDIFRAFGFF